MEANIPKEYISKITKASAYFVFRNGPVKALNESGKINDEELKEMQIYMQNHLAYLYNVLLEESDLKKFDLIVTTMSKFYVNDEEDVKIDDEGFDTFYKKLFPDPVSQIKIQK
ncbi:MAG: hypothetical protein ACRDA5_07615 [Clostridium sp.]